MKEKAKGGLFHTAPCNLQPSARPLPASHQPLEHENRSRCDGFLSSRTVDHSCRATLCSLKDYWLMWQLLTLVLFNLATILHKEFSIPHNKVMNVSSPRSDVWMGGGGGCYGAGVKNSTSLGSSGRCLAHSVSPASSSSFSFCSHSRSELTSISLHCL